MIESRSDAQSLRTDSEDATEQALGRRPFVRPTVEDLGRLQDLTLIGGSL